ncbi:SRPBCC family protein [Flavobacterium sp. SM15]|uniref:SRPBCC family protein n=1 Tax=Flavobacterium sp. SM15 TaxID=2908005 RepID=UPI001EDB7ADF|nr:SRPBCC family protein [Flavobacterium sp. SM15]MCG2610821.1 SRPBCC family protein [Flavobacterium sp. SM15]
MGILKKLLLFIVAVIGILLIAGLFVKKDFAVEREVIINKPEAEVFSYIKLVKNQDHFSVWNRKDPQMKKEYKGTDGEVGFVYAWESTNPEVGKGEQEIVKIAEMDRIDMKLHFKEPFEAEDKAFFTTEPLSSNPANQTIVRWGFKGHMDYPMNLMMLTFDMNKEIGGALETGLNDLKVILEK